MADRTSRLANNKNVSCLGNNPHQHPTYNNMKTHIWNLTKAFPGKVNFVDSSNVILGYDLSQSCCEHTFWTIGSNRDGSDPIHQGDDMSVQEIELNGYCFDTQFYERESAEEEDGGVAIFKLVSNPLSKLPDLFLRLENHHNGYYSHGFSFIRGEVIVEGSL